jgi:hypothetical protein
MAGLTHIEHELARLLIRFGTYPVSIPEYDEETREHQLIELSVAEYVSQLLSSTELDLHTEILIDTLKIYESAYQKGEFPNEKSFLDHPNKAFVDFYCAQIVDRNLLSENWTARHRIYPETEDMKLEMSARETIEKLVIHNILFMCRALDEQLKTTIDIDAIDHLLTTKKRYDQVRIDRTRPFGTVIF